MFELLWVFVFYGDLFLDLDSGRLDRMFWIFWNLGWVGDTRRATHKVTLVTHQ